MTLNVKPLGPICGAYYLDDHDISAIVGPVGSGKSTGSCLRLQRLAYQQRPQSDDVARTRFAIVRNTKPQLKDTTIKTWLQIFPEDQFGQFLTGDMTHHWRFKPEGWDYEIDAEFIFRALDDQQDVANLLSLEATGFYFNELREIDEQILVHAGRRAGRYPPVGEGGCAWSGWFGDSNPWDTDHFLHDWFVDNPREGYKLYQQPGGLDPGAENVENLRAGYYEKSIRDYGEEDARVYVHAQWGRTRAGKPIYSDYIDTLHCGPFELDPAIPLSIGLDFGRTPAATIGQNTVHGWRIRQELCATDMGVKKFGEDLARFLAEKFPRFKIGQVTGDPSGDTRDGSDHTAFDLLLAGGIKAYPASTNEPTIRVEAVNGSFRRLTAGQPSLKIHPDCKMLRRACLDGYHYRKLKVVGQRYDDKPDKNAWSHIAEALQYHLLGGGEGRAVLGRKSIPGNRPRYAIT